VVLGIVVLNALVCDFHVMVGSKACKNCTMTPRCSLSPNVAFPGKLGMPIQQELRNLT